jgi:flagellar biosynthesis/type III secretory pathway protein FliH
MMASRSKKRKALQAYNTMKQVSKPMTIMDVDAAYRKGFEKGYEEGREEGFKQSAMTTIQRTYGAILCAAHELFGFGQERGIRLLNRMHEVLVEMLTDEELAQRVLDEVGVEIDWGQPIELAQPKEPIRTTRATKENHDEGKAV